MLAETTQRAGRDDPGRVVGEGGAFGPSAPRAALWHDTIRCFCCASILAALCISRSIHKNLRRSWRANAASDAMLPDSRTSL